MPEGSHPSVSRGVKQERGSLSKGWPSPPGGSSTATAHSASQGASCGPTVNNKERHPPYWNDDPRTHWLGPLNVGYAYINKHWERVLINSGARCNAMLPEYAKACKMRVGLVHKLAMSPPGDPHPRYSQEYQCPLLCSDQRPDRRNPQL